MFNLFLRRSLLYMPASSLKMLGKAAVIDCDAVILDLEDAVRIGEKEIARERGAGMIESIGASGKEVIVRLNAIESLWGVRDILGIADRKPDAVIVPKADEKALIAADAILWAMEQQYGMKRNSIKMIPLFETAYGIVNAYRILGVSSRIDGVQLGAEDLTMELEIERTAAGREIEYARRALVLAARARGITDIIDTPYTRIKDAEGLGKDCAAARQMGFTGKTCIHPTHIETINGIFSPADAEVEYAAGVLEAFSRSIAEGRGACMYRDKMIDAPIAQRAEKTVRRAEWIKGRRHKTK